MNQLVTQHKQNVSFLFDGQDVRVVVRDGEPWFVAADVCAVLNIANHNDVVAGLDEDEKDAIGITDSVGRIQAKTVISESGLYSVIFKSRKPEAKVFKKWVTAEVLPAIRKTGGYSVSDPMEMLNTPAVLRGLLANYAEERIALTAKIEADAPKVAFAERHAHADGWFSLRDTAKQINIPERKFGRLLLADGYVYRSQTTGSLLPYAATIKRGLMDVRAITITRTDGTEKALQQTMVLPKGLQHFQARYGEEAA
jgi:toxin-antitoxin system, toxin component, bro family